MDRIPRNQTEIVLSFFWCNFMYCYENKERPRLDGKVKLIINLTSRQTNNVASFRFKVKLYYQTMVSQHQLLRNITCCLVPSSKIHIETRSYVLKCSFGLCPLSKYYKIIMFWKSMTAAKSKLLKCDFIIFRWRTKSKRTI